MNVPLPHSNNLETYRKRSCFNKRLLHNFIFSEKLSSFRDNVLTEIKAHLEFLISPPSADIDEQRRLACRRLSILRRIRLKFHQEISSDEEYFKAWIISVLNCNPGSIIQYIIAVEMVPNAIKSLGTKQHLEYYNKILNGEYIGFFGLTEVSHGSNTKGIQTTAKYDKDTQEFVLNTPNFEAAKCWIGNLGKIGTHGVIYAQLITPDGVNHGMHAFVVEIRDPKTHLPRQGIIIADMGEKVGITEIDNGIVIFDHHRIPRNNLLNRLNDVTAEGKYIRYPEIKNPFGFSLGVLSTGRILITCMSSYHISRAVTIAVRYAASKTEEENKKISLLENPTLQVCLFPCLAMAYVYKIISDQLLLLQSKLFTELTVKGSSEVSEELHAITSAAKSVISWSVLQSIRECTSMCDNFGFRTDSGLGNLQSMHEANCTYEGENTVLIQQTSNWLLKLFSLTLKGKTINLLLQSINYINDGSQILKEEFKMTTIEEFIEPRNILRYYRWLVCYLLKRCYEKQELITKKGQKTIFWVKNECQIFFCKDLVFAYIQAYMIQQVELSISKISDVEVQQALNKLLSLYGIWNLQKHVTSFYEGGYVVSTIFVELIEDAILLLCKNIENDAVSLVDIIGPSDDFIRSTIGKYDGQMYSNFWASLINVA